MNAPTSFFKGEKEDDSHPYFRPKDAATLILIDRSGPKPKVLVGRRHDKVVFMPGKYVFPGGRVDKSDNRIPVAASIPAELEASLKSDPSIAGVETSYDAKTKTLTVNLPGDVLFPSGQSVLKPTATPTLDKIVAAETRNVTALMYSARLACCCGWRSICGRRRSSPTIA